MNISEGIHHLLKHVQNLMKHSYADQFVEQPTLDETKAALVYGLLKEKAMDDELLLEYFSSIMLIQAALDLHEQILDPNINRTKKGRQLTVLSGDYYSSLYYLLLAQCEDLDLVRSLSAAIQEINEHKTLIHEHRTKQKGHSGEVFLHSLKKRESLLLTHTAVRFGLSGYVPFIEDYLFLSGVPKWKQELIPYITEEAVQREISEAFLRIRDESCQMPSVFQRDERRLTLLHTKDVMLGEG